MEHTQPAIFPHSGTLTIIGGGSAAALAQGICALTAYNNLTINIISCVTDNGGSTGELRKRGKVPAMGDVRRALGSLTDASARTKLEQRDAHGHAQGNMALFKLMQSGVNLQEASDTLAQRMGIDPRRGRVLPASLQATQLLATYRGKTIEGEYDIEYAPINPFTANLRVKDAIVANPDAVRAIETADVVLLAPGTVLGSIGSILVIDGMRQALARARGPVVAIANLRNDDLHTAGWGVGHYAAIMEQLSAGAVDVLLYNTDTDNQLVSGAAPLLSTPSRQGHDLQLIGMKLVSDQLAVHVPGDALAASRSTVRHDVAIIMQVLDKAYPRLQRSRQFRTMQLEEAAT